MLVPVDSVLSGDRQGRFGAGGTRPGVVAGRLRVRHPGATVDALALDGLTVRAGEVVALRGPSGAGKTTALRVLAGLQPADAGRVELSGPGLLYLPQRPTLPHIRTVADAFPGLDSAAVRAALHTVGLDEEVAPDTALGEHGGGVSSGQRQRLALAVLLRAAHRAPAVLLLDEPTAHLDAQAESLVVSQIREAARRGCAVLVVAHRPGLLAEADRVIEVAPPPPAPIPPEPDPARPEPSGARPSAGGTRPEPDRAAPARRQPAGTPPDADGTRPEPHRAAPARRQPAGAPRDAGRAGSGSAMGRLAAWAGRRPGTAAGLGAASWLAGILLTGAAAWLLVRASSRPPVLTLSTAVVLVRGSAVARPLLRYLERLVAHEVAFARLGEWRARVFAGLIPRMPGPFRHRRGDLLTRIAGDVDARVDGLLRGRLPALAAAATVAVVAVAAVAVLPAVALPLAAGLLISAGIAPALAARQAGRLAAATSRARAESRDAVVETIDGLEELAVPAPETRPETARPEAGARPDAGARPEAARLAAGARPGAGPAVPAALVVPERRSRALARLEARAARSAGAAAALGHLGWAVAVAGTAAVAAGSGLSPEWAAVLLLGIVALGEPVAALPEAAAARRRAAGAETRLSAGAEPHPVAPARSAPPHQPGSGDIVVRGLIAGWDPAQPPALRGVDLDLPAGSRVAVLGPSGGGKSTLAAVLAGLLAPRAGTITGLPTPPPDTPTEPPATAPDTLTGLPAKAPDTPTGPRAAKPGAASGPRRAVLVGDATDHVFATTVRENLRLARPGATDAELRAALAGVRLGEWLAGLPHGLDTWLGTGGNTISGGQRRRLATARALLADPGLLILDEPTEGLDEAGAQELMNDLLAAAAGRTVLLLTHRTEGLDQVDVTFALRGGVQSRCGTSVRGVLTSSG